MDETGHLSRQRLLGGHGPHQFGIAAGNGRGITVDHDLIHNRSQARPNEDEQSRSLLPISRLPNAVTWLGKIRSAGKVCSLRRQAILTNTFSRAFFACWIRRCRVSSEGRIPLSTATRPGEVTERLGTTCESAALPLSNDQIRLSSREHTGSPSPFGQEHPFRKSVGRRKSRHSLSHVCLSFVVGQEGNVSNQDCPDLRQR